MARTPELEAALTEMAEERLIEKAVDDINTAAGVAVNLIRREKEEAVKAVLDKAASDVITARG